MTWNIGYYLWWWSSIDIYTLSDSSGDCLALSLLGKLKITLHMTFWSNIFIIIWYRVLFILLILLSVLYIFFLHIFSCHILIVLKILHCYLYGKFLLVRKIWNLPTLYILMWMGRPPLLMNHSLLALTLLTFNLGIFLETFLLPIQWGVISSFSAFTLISMLIYSSSSPKISINPNSRHNVTIWKETIWNLWIIRIGLIFIFIIFLQE